MKGFLRNPVSYTPVVTRLALVALATSALSCSRSDAPPPAGGGPPPGRLLFVGTYTGGTTGSDGIYAFRFDEATGTLTPRGLAVATPSPSFLTASADRRVVFAVNELDNYEGATSGSVTSFGVDATAAKLTPINTQSSRGAHPCHLELDKTGSGRQTRKKLVRTPA